MLMLAHSSSIFFLHSLFFYLTVKYDITKFACENLFKKNILHDDENVDGLK